MTMIAKLRTAISLSPHEMAATVEAMAEILRAQMAVRSAPPRSWLAANPATAPLLKGQAQEIALVTKAVERAARNFPRQIKCLPLALAARSMLARRRVDAVLSIGMQRSSDADDAEFHAWLKVGQRFITGDCDESRYVLLDSGNDQEANAR